MSLHGMTMKKLQFRTGSDSALTLGTLDQFECELLVNKKFWDVIMRDIFWELVLLEECFNTQNVLLSIEKKGS